MANIPLRSYVYYALCELSDASDNLADLRSCFDDEHFQSLISDIIKDVQSAIVKLHNFSL